LYSSSSTKNNEKDQHKSTNKNTKEMMNNNKEKQLNVSKKKLNENKMIHKECSPYEFSNVIIKENKEQNFKLMKKSLLESSNLEYIDFKLLNNNKKNTEIVTTINNKMNGNNTKKNKNIVEKNNVEKNLRRIDEQKMENSKNSFIASGMQHSIRNGQDNDPVFLTPLLIPIPTALNIDNIKNPLHSHEALRIITNFQTKLTDEKTGHTAQKLLPLYIRNTVLENNENNNKNKSYAENNINKNNNKNKNHGYSHYIGQNMDWFEPLEKNKNKKNEMVFFSQRHSC